MSLCARCEKRKGKRPCPALRAPVCQACCGDVRGRVVPCPEDCRFFPSLSRGHPASQALQSGMWKLMEFMHGSKREWARGAFEACLGEETEVEEWAETCLLAHLMHGHADDNGERLVDIFLRERGSYLTADERASLACLREARFSLFEIEDVRVDEGLALLDLVTEERTFVQEKAATRHLVRLTIVAAWVARLGDHEELTGGIFEVPRHHRATVLEAISEARDTRPEANERALSPAAAVAAYRTLARALREQQPPRLQTFDGEDLVFCEAVFEITDPEAVHARLSEHPRLDPEEDRYVWLGEEGSGPPGVGHLRLGQVRVRGGRLVLETNSKERLEKGKGLLAAQLGDLARHRVDTFKDWKVAMEDVPERPPPEEPSLPADARRQVIGQFTETHVLRWLDEEIPALDGLTPRRAVETEAGREKVLGLLKDHEYFLLRAHGEGVFDFSPIYRELGLPAPSRPPR